MIDLHTHILPGLDDGPATLEGSVAFARAAYESGTETVVATPHIRADHPFPRELIDVRLRELRSALATEGIPLQVLAGGEVATVELLELDDEALRSVCLGESLYVLVESPYTLVGELLEQILFEAQLRGLRPLLAHPERSPCFLQDVERLARLVERGVLCSVTAGSMEGVFGRTVKAFTTGLFERGLVHDVASDSHGTGRRSPGLSRAFEVLDADLPGLADHAEWFTVTAPAAILEGADVPSAPPHPRRSVSRRIASALRGVASQSA
jgi:protein-tyrosine phosphatase